MSFFCEHLEDNGYLSLAKVLAIIVRIVFVPTFKECPCVLASDGKPA